MDLKAASPASGLRCMVGLCLINLIAGLANIWGNLVIYVASFLHQYNADANLSNLAMAFPVQGFSWSLGLIIGSLLFSRLGGRTVIATGITITSLCFLACSFITNLYLFLLLFLFMCGFGPCTICINSFWVGWAYFPNKKGLTTGCIMLFYGGGSALLAIIFTYLMNPDNELPTEKVTVGNQEEYLFDGKVANNLPRTLRIFAVISAAVGIASLILIKDKTKSSTERKSLQRSVVSWHSEELQHCPDMHTALRSSAFWMLFLYNYFSYGYVMFMLIQYKNYAMTEWKDDVKISEIGSIAFAFNTITRFLISILMDYIPFKKVSAVVMLTQLGLALTVHLVVSWPYIYMIWVSLSMVCFAAVFSPMTIACGDIFGTEVGSKVYSIVSQGSILCNFSMIPLVQFIVKPYGYGLAFYILSGTSVVGLTLVLLLKTHYNWRADSLIPKG